MESSRGVAGLARKAMAVVSPVLALNVPRLAAALTYYTVLSLLPALLVVVALLGVVGLSPDTLQGLLDAVGELGAQWAVDFVKGALDGVIASHASTLALVLGALLSLWAASGFLGAFMWAADVIHGTKTMRPFWKDIPVRFVLAIGLLALLALTAAALALVGPVGSAIADATGIGNGPLHLWTWAKWPLLAALGLLMVGLLFRFAPSRPRRGLRALLAGSATTLVLWVVVTAVFSYYLTHWASYDRVYGALATLIAFLVWAWVLNIALLAGALVDDNAGRRGEAPHSPAPPPGPSSIAGA
jgi:membrane protein